MLDFVQKRKVRSVAYHRVTLGVLALLVLVFLHSTWTVFQKKRESEAVKEIASRNLAELEAREGELKAQIENLKTDSGLEAEIRSKFTVAKAGEAMVVVLSDTATTTATSTAPTGFWQKLKSLFNKK